MVVDGHREQSNREVSENEVFPGEVSCGSSIGLTLFVLVLRWILDSLLVAEEHVVSR